MVSVAAAVRTTSQTPNSTPSFQWSAGTQPSSQQASFVLIMGLRSLCSSWWPHSYSSYNTSSINYWWRTTTEKGLSTMIFWIELLWLFSNTESLLSYTSQLSRWKLTTARLRIRLQPFSTWMNSYVVKGRGESQKFWWRPLQSCLCFSYLLMWRCFGSPKSGELVKWGVQLNVLMTLVTSNVCQISIGSAGFARSISAGKTTGFGL